MRRADWGIEQRISDIHVATTTLTHLPPVAPEQAWRDRLVEWRKQLCDELLAIDPNDRDRSTLERQQGLRLSIVCIDRGCSYWPNGAPALGARLAELIQAGGYEPPAGSPGVAWLGSLPEVERRITKWNKERAEAQAQLDWALLDDDEREQLAAEAQARRDALNAMSSEERKAAHNLACGYTAGGEVAAGTS